MPENNHNIGKAEDETENLMVQMARIPVKGSHAFQPELQSNTQVGWGIKVMVTKETC